MFDKIILWSEIQFLMLKSIIKGSDCWNWGFNRIHFSDISLLASL